MLGQMHNQVVLARLQCLQQGPLCLGLSRQAEALPGTVNDVQLIQIRVPGQHVRRIGIDESVNLRLRCGGFECAEHGRGQQDISMVAQFGHQNTANRG